MLNWTTSPGNATKLACLFFCGILLTGLLPADSSAEEQLLFIASPVKPPVIASCRLDLKSGQFSALKTAASDVDSGFLALHPTLPILYAATTEKVAKKGDPNGAVRAYHINRDEGTLELINQAPTGDSGTTHIAVAADGSVLAVCHYNGEGTSALAINKDGSLGDSLSRIAHHGSSVNEKRQTRPHPHGVAFCHCGSYLCVADLGNDHIEVFRVTSEKKLEQASFWQAAAGAGPRHVTFHPNGRWLYCINELNSTISVLDFDAKAGKLTEVQTVPTLPDDFSGKNTTAEVVVHPSGDFLYGSNRGHESTAVFAIDQQTGKLTFVEREPTQGEHPRFVGLDPTGRVYVAANMNSDNLVSFHIDAKTGKLGPTGHQLEVGKPMCIVFVKLAP